MDRVFRTYLNSNHSVMPLPRLRKLFIITDNALCHREHDATLYHTQECIKPLSNTLNAVLQKRIDQGGTPIEEMRVQSCIVKGVEAEVWKSAGTLITVSCSCPKTAEDAPALHHHDHHHHHHDHDDGDEGDGEEHWTDNDEDEDNDPLAGFTASDIAFSQAFLALKSFFGPGPLI